MVVITASYNSSRMGRMKIISVRQTPPITVPHLNIVHRGKADLSSVE